ncbi:S41 family peptidase [Sphingomonas sp. CCH10-B3]|uniref:S41 family peptidase n=2 Tax=Sphingomonas TaxID=13687 RepID=UPI00082CC38B|nr:S41 family peptidase [Sphingomonas sp. CCH10-B3]
MPVSLLARSSLAVAMLGSVLAGPAAAAPPAFDAAKWQADYRQLKAAMEREYANLTWFGTVEGGLDLPRLDQLTRARLAQAKSDGEARRVIASFVTAFGDGHFSSLADLVPGGPAKAAPIPAPEINPDKPEEGCASLGFGVTSPVSFSLPFETLPGFSMMSDGLQAPFRAGFLTTPGGTKVAIIRIQQFSNRAFPAVCTQAWAKLRASGAAINRASVRKVAYGHWYEAFAAQLAAFQSAGASALIVDIGDNSGGNDSGDYFPRMLTDRLVKSAPLRMVASPLAARYIEGQLENLNDALSEKPDAAGRQALEAALAFFQQAAKALPSAQCDRSWVWRERRRWAAIGCSGTLDAGFAGGAVAGLPRGAYASSDVSARLSGASEVEAQFGAWTGPAYALTDGKTYSSAEMFAAVFQDNRIGKTIGTRTGGDGCGFMVNGDPVVLTNSQMRFRMPNCTRLRADGTNEVAGIAPDLPLVPTRGEDDRQRAMRAIMLIEGDLKAGRP